MQAAVATTLQGLRRHLAELILLHQFRALEQLAAMAADTSDPTRARLACAQILRLRPPRPLDADLAEQPTTFPFAFVSQHADHGPPRPPIPNSTNHRPRPAPPSPQDFTCHGPGGSSEPPARAPSGPVQQPDPVPSTREPRKPVPAVAAHATPNPHNAENHISPRAAPADPSDLPVRAPAVVLGPGP